MIDDLGKPLLAELHGCMYVPGLSPQMFSITHIANNSHKASIMKNAVTLFFGTQGYVQSQSPLEMV
jgi:hypothetical protein